MRQESERPVRSGSALVETAVVISVAVLFLFGILEYGRFMFVRQVVDNAAREGARYAVVHNLSSSVDAEVEAVVLQRMAGVQNSLKNFKVKVFKADGTGKSAGSADTAEFGVNIAVQIDADYNPVLPSFLYMGNTIHIYAKALMNSEAN